MSWSSDASPSRHWLSRRRTALPPTLCATLGATTLAACVSGPNFIAPASPPDGGFAAAPLPNLDHGDQRLDSGHGSRAEWWKMLGSPHLDALEDRAGLAAALHLLLGGSGGHLCFQFCRRHSPIRRAATRTGGLCRTRVGKS